jgi:hypothetical protein
MFRIMADHDVVGHVRALVQLCESRPWAEFWHDAQCELSSFADLGLAEDATDAQVWHACQENDVVLITGNRNAEGPQSLELTIRQHNNDQCLPVLTLADQDRILRDRHYSNTIVERLLEILFDLDNLRGSGRLYLP